ncbi:hypothetical protein C8F04DRAFT_1328182 [Mycena alexandri]|uniref:F-box domain-containing protein n=1 Tax=Mycena alexandri TaxID=1745969 RepID=A0AAD6WP09_9AGAR|nr:hypothetical protein C8F04DRAFT_1328182 [Mycena alexandri]
MLRIIYVIGGIFLFPGQFVIQVSREGQGWVPPQVGTCPGSDSSLPGVRSGGFPTKSNYKIFYILLEAITLAMTYPKTRTKTLKDRSQRRNRPYRDRDPPENRQRNGRPVTVTVASLQIGTVPSLWAFIGYPERAMAAPETISESAASILPRELLDLIVSQLGDDKATLQHCTTICKHWLPCYTTFTTFTLHCFRDNELSEPTPGLQALVSSAYSSILPYITDLTVDVHWRQMGLLEPSLALLPDSFLVRTLRLHQAAWDVFWVTDRVYITSRFSAITTLVLHRADCPASELHIILGAFPTLENLFFSTVVWEWKKYVVGDGPINIPPNEHPGHGSLERIHFDDTEFFPFVCWLATAEVVPPIKSLHVSLPLLEVGGSRSMAARPLAKLLSCLASTLEEFTLRHTDLPSRRSPWLTSPGSLCHPRHFVTSAKFEKADLRYSSSLETVGSEFLSVQIPAVKALVHSSPQSILRLVKYYCMDFESVATSQPLQDGEDFTFTLGVEYPQALSPPPSRRISLVFGGGCSDSIDFVGTSQPFQDGEEAVWMTLRAQHGDSSTITLAGGNCSGHNNDLNPSVAALCDASRRRARLVRRVPPSEKSPDSSPVPPGPTPRCLNLVRRVTTGPNQRPTATAPAAAAADLERRKRRAQQKAACIVKKLRTLGAATARLQRKHRQLCTFMAQNKENTPVVYHYSSS